MKLIILIIGVLAGKYALETDIGFALRIIILSFSFLLLMRAVYKEKT